MATERITPGGLSYLLERKQIKKTYIKIKEGKVCVSADRRITLKEVDRIVDAHKAWIIKNLNKPQHQLKNPDICYLLGKAYRMEILEAGKNEIRFEGEKMLLLMKADSDQEDREKLIDNFKRKLAKTVFMESVRRHLPLFRRWNIPMPNVVVRKMKTMWGNCAYLKGRVTFALMLIEQPMEEIDYVVVHELAHFIHHDHGEGFHALMRELMPDYLERRKKLQVH